MSLLYCYGFVEGVPSLDIKGFESKKTSIVTYKDISVIISEVSEKNFSQEEIDKKIKDMIWLGKNATIHENVVESVMKDMTIIPLKFCTIFSTKEKVIEMIKEKYTDVKNNINQLNGKVEMGVKVYFETSKLSENISKSSPDIKKFELEAAKKTSGAAYFDKKKIDVLLKDRVQGQLLGRKKKIFSQMKLFGEEVKQNELIHKKVTSKDMLLNVVFLINKDNIGKFKKDIEKIKKEEADFEFQVWGPFPPYNFVT